MRNQKPQQSKPFALLRERICCVLAILSLLFLSGCTGNVAYNKYEGIPTRGWLRADTMKFEAEIRDSATYESFIAMRIDNSFPYVGLSVIVEQSILHGKDKPKILRDTVNCELIDKHGNIKGSGLSRFQYEFPVTDIALSPDDKVTTKIYHIMNKDTIPSVTEVGYVLRKVSNLPLAPPNEG